MIFNIVVILFIIILLVTVLCLASEIEKLVVKITLLEDDLTSLKEEEDEDGS